MKPVMFQSRHLFSKELWNENCNTTQTKSATYRREDIQRQNSGVAGCPKNTLLSLEKKKKIKKLLLTEIYPHLEKKVRK